MYLKLNLHYYIIVTGQHILRYSSVQVAMRALDLISAHCPHCTVQVAMRALELSSAHFPHCTVQVAMRALELSSGHYPHCLSK